MIKLRDRIASAAGSTLEWYDFSLYGFFAPLLGKVFFPNNLPYTAILKSFAIFAIGFFARPIGAIIFGFIADKYGRTKSLKLTPLLITIPTLGIAILPSYQQIGIFSPLILLSLRIIQGLCIGGEFSNNIVYLCESAQQKRKYFFGSIGSCTGSSGILLGSIVAYLFYSYIPHQDLLLFGWRIAFGTSFLVGLVIYALRHTLIERFTFNTTNPLIESIKNQKTDYLIAIGVSYFPATAFYFIFLFMPNFAHSYLHLHVIKTLGKNVISLIIRILIIPLLGLITDKVGGLLILRISCLVFIVASIPSFYLLLTQPSSFFYCFYLLAIASTLNAACLPGLLVSLLKPETRCTIFSFTFNFCFGIFGGIVPFLGFYLVKNLSLLSPAYYLAFAAVITFVTTFFIKRKDSFYEKL